MNKKHILAGIDPVKKEQVKHAVGSHVSEAGKDFSEIYLNRKLSLSHTLLPVT